VLAISNIKQKIHPITIQLQQRYQKITPLTLVGEVKKEELVRTEKTQYLNHKKKPEHLVWWTYHELPDPRDLSHTLLQIFLEAAGTKTK
jgi:hypothetical protein